MCSMQEVERYWRRLGAALLDRVDIRVRTYYQEKMVPTPSNAELAGKVARAIARQRERGRGTEWIRNGLVPPEAAAQILPLPGTLNRLLRARMQQLGLSERAAASVRAVARTLADLADRDDVEATDILEAAALRNPGPV
jgi:magnesium chelatase family protein